MTWEGSGRFQTAKLVVMLEKLCKIKKN